MAKGTYNFGKGNGGGNKERKRKEERGKKGSVQRDIESFSANGKERGGEF